MHRVVFDTDVLIAALRSPAGASAELLRRVMSRQLRLLANVPLFLEYEAVALRQDQLKAIGVTAASMRQALDELAALTEPVRGYFQWRPQVRDPNDEMVLEAAVNGRADVILSFNLRDFGNAPATWGILLSTPGDFLRSLR
jgi:putative PIN family toxin of toxin-antitoxin system